MQYSIQQLKDRHIGIIDLRSSENFLHSHIKESTSLPWQRLAESMFELPANHLPIALVGELNQVQMAEDFLQSKGYKISQTFIANNEFWGKLKHENLLETGYNSIPLWRANPLLTEIITLVEERVSGRKMIDLACGAGRDSVYLTQRGWDVTGIDNKTDTLERCQRLAAANNVTLKTLLLDLEESSNPLSDLSVNLVLVMRYLHRPLFPAIDQLIQSKGAIIYSTFMVGSEQYGSPKNPNYLLKPGELAKEFATYEILIDEQRELADGRPVALFAAIKP